MSLASDLQTLERELAKVAEHQGGVIVARVLDVVAAIRGVAAVTPAEVLDVIKPVGMSAAMYIGKKLALGFTFDSAAQKLLAEIRTNAPTLASACVDLYGTFAAPDTKRAA